MREIVGLLRNDGKWLDGFILITWSQGKSVTVIHSMADILLTVTPKLAATRKTKKYVSLPAAYIFQPITFETLGH